MKDENKLGEGLISQLINKMKWNKQFTKDELKELKQIKKNAYMNKMREIYKIEGEKLALNELNNDTIPTER